MKTKRDLVRDYLDANPGRDKIAIARELATVYPDNFKTVEEARGVVRAVTGSAGKKQRKQITDPDKSRFFYNGFEKWVHENLNTELAPWDEPFIIPSSIKQLSIIADLHSVHLDHKCLELFLMSTKNKEALLINGDLMDSESLSRHLKGHNLVEYDKEIELCHQILKGLKQEFDHVYFKAGNHDFWLERYLLSNAREIFRLRGLELKELLRCGELGVEFIHNLKYITFGDIDIIHAHEFGGWGGGKFPARSILDKWQTFKKQYDVKILGAHSHKIDYAISSKSKDGKFGQGYSMGCMCRQGAHYAPYAGWDNGWAVIKLNNGISEVDLIKV